MPDTDAPDTESLADAPLQRSLLVGSPRLSPARVRRLAELGIRAGCTVVALSRTPDVDA